MRTAPEGSENSVLTPSTALAGRATRAIIDLDAIAQNVSALRRYVAPAALMTVVKGNAYGHGLEPVARAAVDAGASWLGVYTVGEGMRLRSAGIDARVLVLGPFNHREAERLVALGLTPTVSSLKCVEGLAESARNDLVPVHVEVDTGMTRAGVRGDQLLDVLDRIRSTGSLVCEGLFTHLAGAGFPDEPTAVAQLHEFRSLVQGATEAGHVIQLVHAANSAGSLNFPESHFSLVRVGISTYGYYPSSQSNRVVSLRPALSLRSAISRVEPVPSGIGVGYNHDFVTERPSMVALVPIGYADGLHRAMGNGRGRVLVRGRFAPIVGRVSMDQITIDATDVPGVSVGDEVVLIGELEGMRQTADDAAESAGTISYEVLSALLPRVPRVYLRGGHVVAVVGDDLAAGAGGCAGRGPA